MKIIILDDHISTEWFDAEWKGVGLLTKVIPTLSQRLPNTAIKVEAHNITDYWTGNASDPTQIHFVLHPLNPNLIASLLNKFGSDSCDLFLIDCSIDGNDRSEGGVLFAEQLAARCKLHDDQICIVTNKAKQDDIRSQNISKFKGRFTAILKDNEQDIAAAIIQTVSAPSRSTISAVESIVGLLYKDRQPLERYFHPKSSPQPTKAAVIAACNDLTTTLSNSREAVLLRDEVTKHLLLKGDDELVDCSQPTYLRLAAPLGIVADDPSVTTHDSVLLIGAKMRADENLRDLLFPRVKQAAPFSTYIEQMAKRQSIDIVWPGVGTLPNVISHPCLSAMEGAVALSWLLDFNAGWLGDLKKHANINELSAYVFGTEAPHHLCVLFWHQQKGFPDQKVLSACAGKLFQNAVMFSHAFIASAWTDSGRALVEVLPLGDVRSIPSCRIHFGKTCVDFSRWKKGSAFLFALPAIR